MANQQHELPEYENPPISEVALSVEFTPVEGWRGAHGGLFWHDISADYPISETKFPIPSEVEDFGSDLLAPPNFRFGQFDPDLIRYWFFSEPRDRIVQVQADHFVVNWRKVRGDEVYPRYANDIRPRFHHELDRFRRFLNDRKLGGLNIRQCEVVYVNDIPRGEGWDKISDIRNLLSPWTGETSDGFLPDPTTLNIDMAFTMPERSGRLRFAAQHLRRATDGVEVIQIRLTARSKPTSNNDDDILKAMDLGREWVVRGFTDLSTNEAHKKWKRTR